MRQNQSTFASLATVALLGLMLGVPGCRSASEQDAGPVAAAPAPAPAEPSNPSQPIVVPEGEAEPPAPGTSAVPERPKLSFGRQEGLHRTPDPLRLQASAAIVMAADSGEVLYAKNEDAVLPIASLTKLMTGLIVTQARLPMDEQIVVTQDDVDTERNSRSRLRVGTALTRAEALHLALMSSENRAAHALARTYPGGMNAFVEAMNNKARQLGMAQTTFVDPTGLSNRNRSTVRDLALLTRASAEHAQLREYSTTREQQVEFGGRKLLYRNSNRLIKDPDWDIHLQKTGYIVEAGQCVAMATRVNGQDIIMVLLDSASKGSRSADAQRLRRHVVARADDGPHSYAAR